MDRELKSRNFFFLCEYDSLLEELGLRAEVYVYSDPNASLVKSRQFGELIAKMTAAKAGLDCAELPFDRTVAMLRRQRILPRDILDQFNQLRLAGNQAVHEFHQDRQLALQSLICAYELAKWFRQRVMEDPSFCAGPFCPPAKPSDATNELQAELGFLREEAARQQLSQSASQQEIRLLSEKLEQEAANHQATTRTLVSLLQDRDIRLEQMQMESRERLKTLSTIVQTKQFQSYAERTENSRRRTSNKESAELPILQLRIMTGENSVCCGTPKILVQSSGGGFITKNCSKCNRFESLRKKEFDELSVYVACARCRAQATPTLRGSNYAYECSSCDWSCELAVLVPHYTDVVRSH